MKQLLQFRKKSFNNTKAIFTLTVVLLLPVLTIFAQDLTINRTVTPNDLECNQFDVTLEIMGTPAPKPIETILIIDASGSMDDGGSPLPIDAAKDAAEMFVNNLFAAANNPTGLNKVSIVSYSTTATLEIGLTGSSGQTQVLDAINQIVAGGRTNIQDALLVADQEMINSGTYDCKTERSILLLTDGVANQRNTSSGTAQCESNVADTQCQLDAITAGQNAQTTTVGGVEYRTNIFGIGLFAAISGTQQNIANSTLDRIQNAGLFVTENNADLSGVYNTIFGQLVAAATAVDGEPLVMNTIGSGFDYVSGSLNASTGTASFNGDDLTWFVDRVFDETITLDYSIIAVGKPGVCGTQDTGNAVIKYIDSDCNIQQESFNNPEICVPCPEVDASIKRVDCDNAISYGASIDQGDCTSSSDGFSWKFFLNNTQVGTSNQQSGIFNYTGSADFEGDFKAELIYTGNYGSGCPLEADTAIETLQLPDVLVAGIEKTNATTSGNCKDGIASASIEGGTGDFSYSWSPGGQTTPTISNLGEGTYTVTITDNNTGCEVQESVVITCYQDEWFFECGDDKAVEEFGFNANCLETSVVSSLNDQNNMFQYVVEIVYDSNNPGQTIQFTDDTNTARTLERSPIPGSNNEWFYRGVFNGSTSSITYEDTHTECNLQSIVVYAFKNVPDAPASSGIFTELEGVNNLETFTIDIPTDDGPRDLTVDIPVSELTNDGRYLLLRAEAAGISDEVILLGADTSLPGNDCCLAIPSLSLPNVPGTVSQVTITVDSRNNQNGQGQGQSWIISGGVNVDAECFECDLAATFTKEDVLCNGDSTGSIDVTVSGGTAPFTFAWSNGADSEDLNNIPAGNYSVTITDVNNCEFQLGPISIEQPEPINIELTKTNANAVALCNNGTATATVSGGTPPYTYLWDDPNAQTTPTATGLSADPLGGTQYTVVVTDANGCTEQQSIIITCVQDCDAVISVDDITDVLCKNDSTGSATVSASSAANPNATFTFTWNTTPPQVDEGVTSSTINNQSAGVYTVSVTIDGTLCLPVEESITITEPSTEVSVTATATDENGPTTGDGTATANPSGGTPPYTYLWSPGGETTQTITGLSAGDYTVTVTDANGCTAMDTVTVNPGDCNNLSVATTPTDVSCNGGDDGSVTAVISGGDGPFTYSWSPGGETTQTISGLSAGTYTVTVTDQTTQCTAESTAVVGEPTALSTGIAVTDVLCFGDPSGSLDLTVSGGTPPYTFLWSNGETTEDISGLVAGTYSVTVTDANGCTIMDSATVSQPDAELDIEITSQTDIVCAATGTSTGSVTVSASGGTAPYTYSLDGGTPQSSGTFNDLTAGEYTITVVDANGCDDSIIVTILENCILAVDDINDTFVDLPVSGDVGTNDINTDGPAGTEVFTLVSGPSNGGVVLNADGTYTYTPGAGYVGEDSFVYQVCDGGSPIACDTATVYIEVQPVGSPDNAPPVANADTNSTQAGTPVDGNVLPNDYDPDGDDITVTGNTDPANGTVTVNPDGSYTYTPDPGFTGEDTFEYTICDTGSPALCDTATVTIQVLDTVENITTAVDDAYYGFPDADIVGNVLDNDTDPEGDAQTVDLAVSPSNGPGNGTVVFDASGNGGFTYTPNAGYSGTDSFVYEIFDSGSPVARDVATVYISIDPAGGGNDILAVDDINDTFVDLPVSGDVSTNDENFDGPMGTEIFTLVSGPTAGGTLTFNSDGTYDYVPASGYVGDDTFVYQICDGGNPIACDTATVTITIVDDPIIGNDPPVALNDVNITQVDTPIDGNVLVNDFDPDQGDTISVTSNTAPSNGAVTLNADGNYTYTPNPGFEGVDTFEYTICDDATPALCDSAIVTIYVIPNRGNITVANDDAYYGEINTTLTGNVLDNDADPEMDSQAVDVTVTPVSGPTNGTVTVFAGGTFNYEPNPDFVGNDQFVYEIFDNGSPIARDRATVYILIEQTPAPAIAIVKTGEFNDEDQNQCSDVDETITYTFTVTNEGNVALGNILITDPLLESPNPVVPIVFVDGDTDGDDELDVDETWTYTANYAITQADIDNGEVVNQATVEGTDEDGTTVSDVSGTSTTTDDETSTTLCQNAAIALVKEADVVLDPDGQCVDIDLGGTIDYIFTVTNEGNVSLDNLELTDDLLDNETFVSGDDNNDGILQVDETWIYNGSYEITQDDIDAGEVTNTATITADDPNDVQVSDISGTTINDNDPTVTPICQVPVIIIVKEGSYDDGGDCSQPGELIDYTFTVTNGGNVSLENIIVTDPLLEAPNPVVPIVFVGGDTDGDDELDTDEIWTYTASYAITQDDIDAGEVINQATAEGTSPTGTMVSDISGTTETTNDSTVITLCQNAAIALVKEANVVLDPDGQCVDIDLGGTIDYIFTVTNEGNVSLDNLELTDDLLDNEVFVSGDDNNDGILQVDETWIYNGSYEITQDDIDAGEVTNTATITADDPKDVQVSDISGATINDDDPTVTPICQVPVIIIVKSGEFMDGNGDQCANPGEMIDYTFTVTNIGNVSLSNITVTDPLLEDPNPVVPIIFVGGDTDGDNELDVDEIWTYTASYTITQNDIDAGEVINQATAEGTSPSGTMVSDISGTSQSTNDPTVVTLCQNPAIAIVKAGSYDDGGDCSQPGELIDYTFTVTNQGNVSLSSITVTDPLLEDPNPVVPIVFTGGDTDNDDELDVDETWTYAASYAITQDDIDAGEVNNQATVEGTAPDSTVVSDLSGTDISNNDIITVTLCQGASIALIKKGIFNDEDGDGCASPKETITYTFEVYNNGNVTLSQIDIEDPLVNVLGGPITLAPGDSDLNSFTATYVILQGDIDNGEVVNQATVTGLTPSNDTVSDDSDFETQVDDRPTITPLCQNASIALIKTAQIQDDNQNGCIDLGESIIFNFVVKNTGNVILTNVMVTDPLVAVTGGPITLSPDASDSDTFRAEYIVTQDDVDAGFVINQALAEGTTPNNTTVSDLSDNNSFLEDDPTEVGLCQEPNIALEKTGVWDDNNGDRIPQVGETISYQFTVKNTGNVTLFDLTLEDDLPGIEISGDSIVELAAGEEDTTTFTAVYAITQADIDNLEVVNQAVVRAMTADGTEVNDLSDDPTDLTNTDVDGDGDPDDVTVVILPDVEAPQNFEIFNGITPDGDGLNDFFNVFGIENYGPNNMKIYNRWGVLVWETDNYGGASGRENVFEGFSNGRATIRDEKTLPTGTYFYILNFTTDDNPGDNNYTGYLYINR